MAQNFYHNLQDGNRLIVGTARGTPNNRHNSGNPELSINKTFRNISAGPRIFTRFLFPGLIVSRGSFFWFPDFRFLHAVWKFLT